MKISKKALSWMLCFCLALSMAPNGTLIVGAESKMQDPTIVVSEVNATAGDAQVEVPVSIQNNPGIVGMTLKLIYDETVMTLTSVTRGEALSEMTSFTKPRNLSSGCRFPWAAEEVSPENVTNGEILILTFKVSDTAPNGRYNVTFTYDEGAIIDNDLNPVSMSIRNGAIVVGNTSVEETPEPSPEPTVAPTTTPAPTTQPTPAPTAQPTTTPVPVEGPAIVVNEVNASAGDTQVDVPVSIQNNPGIVGMTLKLTYDETVMTLTSVTRGEALSEMTSFTKPRDLSSGCRFPWAAEEVSPENVTNGEILILTFKVSDTAPNGRHNITFTYDEGAIIDNDLNPVSMSIRNGAIVVGNTSVEETPEPSSEPTAAPTATPLPTPTPAPTVEPTSAPTVEPMATPAPTTQPTPAPTAQPTTTPVPVEGPAIVVNEVNASAGDTQVDVPVSIQNNPGIVGMTLKLTYDETVMTLTSVTRGEALSEMTSFTKPRDLSSGCRFPWAAEEVSPENVTNGEILILTFKVSDAASNGRYNIIFTYDEGAIIDNDLNPVSMSIRNGAIVVGNTSVEETPEPSPEPTAAPTATPLPTPTPAPTAEPTPEPTVEPTPTPTVEPTATPVPDIGTKLEINNVTNSATAPAIITAPVGGWIEGDNTFTVACAKPCFVAVSYDNGVSYHRLPASQVSGGYDFTVKNMTVDTILTVGYVGDVNGDGTISNSDSTKLAAIYASKTTASSALMGLICDVNNDGQITNSDITALRATYAGKRNLSW